MKNANKKLMKFLENNPNASKTEIGQHLKMNGLPLFNLLKAHIKEGVITVSGEGSEATYSLAEAPLVVTNNETEDAPPIVEQTVEKKSTGRNNDKYQFMGDSYGKGQLVLRVVGQYIEDHPDTTHKQLKEAFPDTLMKRFGVFATESEAKKLSGSKPRYFFKPEQLIKIKGQKEPIAICNQWTGALMINFLTTAKGLGYKIK